MTVATAAQRSTERRTMSLLEAAALPADVVLRLLGTGADGLTTDEALRRRASHGPNAVREHRARALRVLGLQVKSPLLLLLGKR